MKTLCSQSQREEDVKTLKVKWTYCPHCGGQIILMPVEKKCPSCNGTGAVVGYKVLSGERVPTWCDVCKGTGGK